MHFLTAFHQNLGKHLGHTVPVLKPHGDLHLDDWHKQNPPIEGRYWYIIAGGKSDMTTKIWSAHRWQQVVNILRQFGIRFVQDGAVFKGHRQPNLAGVLNTVGRTGLRDMLWMIYHADGVICHVTAAAHFAAALERPCVVIAGGREMWWWEAYVNTQEKAFGPLASPVRVPHRYLHTIGQLKCCQEKGCWRAKVHKGEPDKNHSYCHAVVDDGYGQQYPRCLANITVGHVVEAVLSYYGDGTTTKDEICGTSTVQNMPDVPATLRNTATDRSCTADCPA
jgi:ADP-heptose:LPS heptosyltransferase